MDNSLQYPELTLLIGGHAQPAGNRRTLDVMDPATQAVLGRLPVATSEDIDAALLAAHQSFPRWRDTPALERAAILRRAAA
ncbi:aldehyde dehydrogenase family protein, partial [Achromobacter sp.]|uniref:aldehyde dehydrogenase family protein n=1 Tax=Achromobacter sp. TaxID=134375 RepID=UPI002F921956